MFKEYPELLFNKTHKLKQGQRKQLRRAGSREG
jgi:hemoglobin-like flavoprotein